jgi:pimeloyl-ACP methyl ester carboxylesterase
VLVNGWTASGLVWPARLVRTLARSFHVLRIDNRGTGWSRHLRHPFTIGDLADDVRRVIDDRGLDRPVVVGISMGGMITQELALRAPDRVAHAVLLGTRPPAPEHTNPPAFVTARLMSPPQPGQPLGEFMRQRWEAVTGPGFHARQPRAMGEMVRTIVQRPTPRGAVLDQARAIAGWSGAGRLRRLEVPVTVVHGSDDPLIPVRNGMRLAQLIPDARYVELPGVGHLVPHEAPDTVARLVSDIARGR